MGNNNQRTAIAVAVCAALGATASQAATFNVTTTADSGAGSLRQALIDANANAEADTIQLSAISGQTITLSSGELATYNDEITIEGAGVTVDAAGSSRVLYSYSTNLTVNNLTITGGDAGPSYGGGLFSYYGGLELNDTTITGNTAAVAGGLLAVGYYDISIQDSVISGNQALGGGVRGSGLPLAGIRDRRPQRESLPNFPGDPRGSGSPVGGAYLATYGNVTISGTTISGNSAGQAAGFIAVAADVTVTDSTISGNIAGGQIGAGFIQTKYDGDGLVSNSTISGNVAENGPLGGLFTGFGDGGSMTIQFSTFTGNAADNAYAGGLFVDSPTGMATSLNGTIISGNSAATDPDVGQPDDVTTNVNFSLIGNAPSQGTFNTDATSASLLGANPQLGPLANNGGPTLTHLPGAGSPARDVVPADGTLGCGTSLTTDQRGSPRPQGTGCDLGSVEISSAGIPEAIAVPVLDRIGLLLMAGLLGIAGFLGLRRRADRRS